MKRRLVRADSGYTLIELIISMTLLATITGALVAAFITTNNANANTSERIHESNDAQLTAGFWTADAQAAGGVDPLLGATDATLGVSKSDAAGCGSGTLVSRFMWREWSSRDATTTADTYVTRVANYFYDSGTNELRRQTCADGTPSSVMTLATRVASAPEVRCDGSTSCPSLPNTVSIRVIETNDPPTAGGTPFEFTLNATVRSNDKAAPTATTATSTPLIALGSGPGVACDADTPTGLFISGHSTVVVNGTTVINATNRGTCHAINANGSLDWYGNGTGIAPGGDCDGNRCDELATTTSVAVGNPFAGLVAPSTAGCTSGPNQPPMGGGQYQPGTYRTTLTLSGAQVMAPGTYVLCNGIAGSSSALSPGVFLYVAGGTLTKTLQLVAPTTGTYAGIAVWNGTATGWTFDGGANINLVGVMYAPGADITVTGNASFTVSALIARRIFFIGTQGTTITGSGTPGSPTVVATTGTTLRHVNVSWTPPYFQGTSAISNYQYRVDTGAGFGGWIDAGLTTTLDHTCGTSNTVPTTCKYQVRAINAQGFGSPSNIAVASSAFDGVAPPVAITAPTSGAHTGLATTITGTAGNAAGDSATVVVSLYAGSNCTGAVQTFDVTRTDTAWSVPSGALTVGAYSVCATQSDTAGNVGAAGPINFNAGQVLNVGLANGSGASGRADRGDTVTVQFAQAMTESTICSGWSGNGNQSITAANAVTVTITDGGGANDTLTVSATTCPTFNFGTIDLGSTAWVNATTQFKGTGTNSSRITYTAASNTLLITLGTGTGSGTLVPASTVTYTPGAALRDAANTAITGIYAFVNQRF